MLKNRNIPFGYCVVNGKYTINESEAEAVRKIFSGYINGKSLKIIAKEMTIPYNTGKAVWNKNMVCRILENKKYIGENGYPKIITEQDFEEAARIKAERNTYRKPIPQDNPQKIETTAMLYEPTEEIQRMTNEINRLLDSENSSKDNIETLIIECTQLKYATIKEVNVK
ncbi:MAG: recombinase family protein [Firmicutes bacterium]|nr:recombinase family protein [Bacillota bacterium]